MPDRREIEKAEQRADESIEEAKRAAVEEERTRGGVKHDYGGEPPEHSPEEIDQPPRQ